MRRELENERMLSSDSEDEKAPTTLQEALALGIKNSKFTLLDEYVKNLGGGDGDSRRRDLMSKQELIASMHAACNTAVNAIWDALLAERTDNKLSETCHLFLKDEMLLQCLMT